MNLKELTKHIAENEGLKNQVSVGNIREIIGLFSDLLFKEGAEQSIDTLKVLIANGKRRSKKKKKVK